MRPMLFLALLLLAATQIAAAQEITGSGSTFVWPVLAKWADAYQKISGTQLTYQPIGSSGGITEIGSGLVDFGATDAPLDDAKLLRDGLTQFPVAIGAIVPVVNLDGIAPGQLRFTGALLADIYLGKVTNWNDPAIAAVNPDLKLPNRKILVVYRAEGSGTTYNWSDYLAKVSPEWSARVGVGTKLAWPTGVSGKGNGGVADNVARVPGAIGYVEYGYAVRSKLPYAMVRNRAGAFVSPTPESLQAAVDGVDWAKNRDFYVLLSDAPSANAWPIVAMSFVLIHRYPKEFERSRRTLAFFRWAIERGQDMAGSMHYLPLPASLTGQIESYWDEQIRGAAQTSRN